jgi:hypothetical protein
MSENNLPENEQSVETSNLGVPGHSLSRSRRVGLGDTSPRVTHGGIEAFEIKESVAAAQEAQAAAVRDIVASAPVDDMLAVANSLRAILEGPLRKTPRCSAACSRTMRLETKVRSTLTPMENSPTAGERAIIPKCSSPCSSSTNRSATGGCTTWCGRRRPHCLGGWDIVDFLAGRV